MRKSGACNKKKWIELNALLKFKMSLFYFFTSFDLIKIKSVKTTKNAVMSEN